MDDKELPQGMQPGKDSDEHTQALQSNVADVLGVPQDQVVPARSSDAPKPVIDLENIREDINAAVPWPTPTSRLAKSKEFLLKLIGKLRKKDPGKEIKAEEAK